jgi:hypothetical protein
MTSEEMRADVLMKEYASMREEVLLHFRNTKLHWRYYQVFFTAAIVIIWYLFFVSNTNVGTILLLLNIKQPDLLLYVVFALDLTSYYFAFDILDSYFCIFLAAACLANIEEQINAICGRTILVWESQFQAENVVRFGSSRFAITAYQLLLVFGVSAGLPIFCYLRLRQSGSLSSVAFSLSSLAIAVCVALLLWFAYTFISVFFIKRAQARRTMDDLIAGKIKTKKVCADKCPGLCDIADLALHWYKAGDHGVGPDAPPP